MMIDKTTCRRLDRASSVKQEPPHRLTGSVTYVP
jgi:hypothetical protein